MGLCWCSQVDDGTNKRGGVVMPTNDIHVNLEIKGCSTAEDVMRYVYDDIEMPKPGKSHMRVNGVCTSLLVTVFIELPSPRLISDIAPLIQS
mmetsp:Transcript_22080/g.30920  ORF Transcript_22080/g.30920 Transcript_22080/m.30920 type:complete len:92 (+) Transcript_22080:223-498(+)